MDFKKLAVLALTLVLVASFSLCTSKSNDNNTTQLSSSEYLVHFGNQSQVLTLRADVLDTVSVDLVNTSDAELKNNYFNNSQLAYIEYDPSLPNNEGGVAVMDLKIKLINFNGYYIYDNYYKPHNIASLSSIDGNNTGIQLLVYRNESNPIDIVLNATELDIVKNSNKTTVFELRKTNNTATITKVGFNHYLIEGNSLEEIDKAESRLLIALVGNVNNSTTA
ncbi:hypothetical protein [Methanococcus voltae]|uniref:Uncharacterized protein n=1 Tax=Methanococcus voltae (strain ATCC BAA-1334 / A3) TaxID=456320 RepID=D7DTG9_METV3|nr:hypothetical protein [Methanococcus voltae]MCS3901281.1 hypothetical protein [Methanococcus voltae]